MSNTTTRTVFTEASTRIRPPAITTQIFVGPDSIAEFFQANPSLKPDGEVEGYVIRKVESEVRLDKGRLQFTGPEKMTLIFDKDNLFKKRSQAEAVQVLMNLERGLASDMGERSPKIYPHRTGLERFANTLHFSACPEFKDLCTPVAEHQAVLDKG